MLIPRRLGFSTTGVGPVTAQPARRAAWGQFLFGWMMRLGWIEQLSNLTGLLGDQASPEADVGEVWSSLFASLAYPPRSDREQMFEPVASEIGSSVLCYAVEI